MGSDGFPSVIEAVKVIETIATVAHRRDIPMPQFEIDTYRPGDSREVESVKVEAKWYPSIDNLGDTLIPDVAAAFIRDDEWYIAESYHSYSTTLHGIDVEFTIHHK